MTHTVHPYSHRLGILRGWKSRWFGVGKQYQVYLKADVLLREYLEKKLRAFHVSSIEIERGEKTTKVIIKTSRPGLIIGRSGEGAVTLKKDVEKFLQKNKLISSAELKIEIEEVRSPESDASIVAQMVRDGLEKRMPFRRVLKQTVEKVIANRNVEGVRILISGRLGGAEMARKEQIKKGRIPLQTFRADIDFSKEIAKLPYGIIGIKVWVYRGDIFDK